MFLKYMYGWLIFLEIILKQDFNLNIYPNKILIIRKNISGRNKILGGRICNESLKYSMKF